MPAHFPVAAITDEFSPDIEVAVRSMTELGMTGAELRMVFGKNIIDLSDEELDRELHLAALQSREPYETLHQRLTDDGGLARIREQLKREKTASLLYERLPA